MKRLLLFLWLFAVSLPSFGANPSYDAFIGTNGIIVSSNPPQGRVIIDGGALSLGALLWTNEPAGRIHPTVFTNRVEVQRVFTVGTNSSGFITLNSNDLFVGYRDLAKGERIAPKFTAGIFSNTFSSALNAFFDHRTSTFESRVIDGNGNFDSLIAWGARANNLGGYISITHTNGITTFSFDSTNHLVLNNVGYFWPPAQGAAGTVLTNNGSGTLGWGTASGGGGDSLWTNEPSGRIHPIEFTNRVELQRSLTIGTNSETFGGPPGTNDFLIAYRDITKAEDYNPRVEFGVFSNAVFSTITANLLRDKASWSIRQKSESTHQGTTEIGVDASGPLLVMNNTNGTVIFGVAGETNITFQGIVYAFPPAQGAAQTVLTNDGFGNLGWGAGGGGGGVNFSDLVWTNQLGTIKPIAFPTNILFNVAATEGGVQTNFYFESRVYRTNAATKLFAIYNGGSNAVTVGPYGGLFMGRANQTPYPGVVVSGIYDQARGETNQQEIFVMSQNSAVGYLGAADILVDTNYGAIILTSQSPGGTRFSRWAIQAGAGIDPEKFNTFSMQALVDNATYFQVDPNFTLLTATNYLFSSSVRITNTHILLSLQNSNFPVLEVDGVGDLRLIKKVPYLWPSAQGAAGTVLTNNGSGTLGWGSGPTAAAILTGTTNYINLSVQAAKLPNTNYPSIDAGWQAWETVYAETNAEGSRVNLSANWQFMVPTDYATNSLKLLINYSLVNTNGPNTSNVVWGASVLVIRNGTTNNVHTNLFGTSTKGSNDWIAKYDGTNIVTNLVIDLSVNSLIMPRDLSVIKLERFPTEDTYGGAVAIHGLQLEYTRP